MLAAPTISAASLSDYESFPILETHGLEGRSYIVFYSEWEAPGAMTKLPGAGVSLMRTRAST